MGRQEAEMLHRFRLVKGAKTADGRLGGGFDVEQVFERKLFETSGLKCRQFGAGERPRHLSFRLSARRLGR